MKGPGATDSEDAGSSGDKSLQDQPDIRTAMANLEPKEKVSSQKYCKFAVPITFQLTR